MIETREKSGSRANGGLDAYSDLGTNEHRRCPWRCSLVTTALNVRTSADILLLKELYLGCDGWLVELEAARKKKGKRNNAEAAGEARRTNATTPRRWVDQIFLLRFDSAPMVKASRRLSDRRSAGLHPGDSAARPGQEFSCRMMPLPAAASLGGR